MGKKRAEEKAKLEAQVESPPQQERSRETLRKLLEGAEQLFAEVSINEATVPQICARAGCTTGAFYRRFRDKDELLDTLFTNLLDDVTACTSAALDPTVTADLDLADCVSRFVGAMVDVYARRAGLCRAIMISSAADASYDKRVVRQARQSSQQLAALLQSKRNRFDHPDTKLAADFAFRIVFATLDQTVRFLGEPPTVVKLSSSGLAKELTRSVLGYIGYRGPTKSD